MRRPTSARRDDNTNQKMSTNEIKLWEFSQSQFDSFTAPLPETLSITFNPSTIHRTSAGSKLCFPFCRALPFYRQRILFIDLWSSNSSSLEEEKLQVGTSGDSRGFVKSCLLPCCSTRCHHSHFCSILYMYVFSFPCGTTNLWPIKECCCSAGNEEQKPLCPEREECCQFCLHCTTDSALYNKTNYIIGHKKSIIST